MQSCDLDFNFDIPNLIFGRALVGVVVVQQHSVRHISQMIELYYENWLLCILLPNCAIAIDNCT